MTDEELRAIEERAAKATPGPWSYYEGDVGCRDRDDPENPCDCHGYGINGNEGPVPFMVANPNEGIGTTCGIHQRVDAEFIAHARTDVPALVAEIRRLKAAELAAVLPGKEGRG